MCNLLSVPNNKHHYLSVQQTCWILYWSVHVCLDCSRIKHNHVCHSYLNNSHLPLNAGSLEESSYSKYEYNRIGGFYLGSWAGVAHLCKLPRYVSVRCQILWKYIWKSCRIIRNSTLKTPWCQGFLFSLACSSLEIPESVSAECEFMHNSKRCTHSSNAYNIYEPIRMCHLLYRSLHW